MTVRDRSLSSRGWAAAAALLVVAVLWWTGPSRPAATPSTRPADTDATGRDAAAAADALPSVTLTLAPLASRPAGRATPAPVPRGTAQVRLRLMGDLPPADDLTAEISAVGRDEVRRWPVDDAAPDADGATRVVTVPPYTLPAGDYELTLWAGDADVVQRYAFAVDPR